ncbi:uncharacterized protein SPPG_03312 [Spizellomyces punctatus DAOM BR117]|uniref:Uncharacterized protein n=1 Tax=Spizellomyces punctatus (strain DAOM BR117) TaxID=645134 RepID=A0A0L0HKU0_SPIPD|nr:uncharacterized protein SPPG_03312 [Spizellomyces punctatus DAOM BR117]KND01515.1 hypothetical protein SPPG_03312 [Spizellomyces punctatus DAOM BR117]|eukprot:XP_016609554.1 hypothetical protein SPPG_03312 [Spizellomyces punctatus DAOM BR117]
MREGHEKNVEDERRENIKIASIQRFRSRHGIYNPGESLLETTGLGTRGTDISATRDQFNAHRGPQTDTSRNIFYQEDTPSTVSEFMLHRRPDTDTDIELAINTPLPISPISDAIVPGSAATPEMTFSTPSDITTRVLSSPSLVERTDPRDSSRKQVFNPRTGLWIFKNGNTHKELKREWRSHGNATPKTWKHVPY